MLNKMKAGGAVLAAATLALTLYACGGGGSSSGSGTATLSGTAATGQAVANAVITITGAAGGTVTATSGADGSYTADVSSLTAPYLEKISTGTGTVLYSVGAAAGTVNIHPLTDLIVRAWYEAQGKTADAAFADPAGNPPPTATEVAVVASVVQKVVAKWLTDNGIDPTQFDPITTSFKADGTGFDAVLDTLTIDHSNPAAPVITINAGASGTQTTNLTVGGTGDISASTTLTAGGVTSTSFTSAFVPASAAAKTALSGVLTTLSNMAAVINAKGASLTAADISPFVDSAYLGGGENATQFATSMASDMAGNTLDSFTVDHIVSFDSVNNIISIDGKVTVTSGGTKVVQEVNENGDGLIFKLQSDGSWKFFGNQQRAKINLKTETSRRLANPACTGCSGVFYDLQIQVGAPVGAVTSATVTGNIGGSTQTLSMTKNSGTFTDSSSGLVTEQFDLLSGVSSTFYVLASPSEFPPAGSSYTIHVVFADSSTADYTRVLGASTSEAMTLQAGVESTVGHSASASLDHPVTLSWNLPVTFPIASVEIYGDVADTNGNHCNITGPDLAANATTGTMTLPSTCNNLSLQINPGFPSISVVVTGTSGESTNIWYAFQ